MPADKTRPAHPSWLRPAILVAAGAQILLNLFYLLGAAATWSEFPKHPVVVAYFVMVLIVLPLLAVWAFVLAWQDRQLGFAAALASVLPIVFLVRLLAFGVV